MSLAVPFAMTRGTIITLTTLLTFLLACTSDSHVFSDGGRSSGRDASVSNVTEEPRQALRLRYDEHGIPHVRCESDEQCWEELGYVHAKHRLFQMDHTRRSAGGWSATLMGAENRDADLHARRYFTTRRGEPLADAVLRQLRDESRQWLSAYSDGVNRRLNEVRAHRELLPPEYRELQIDAEQIPPWTSLDSIAIWNLLTHAVGDHAFEATLSTYEYQLDEAIFRELFEPKVLVDAYHLDQAPEPTRGEEPRRWRNPRFEPSEGRWLIPTLPHFPGTSGSNNWAVAGARTATGHAILANDPHGGHGNPPSTLFVELHANRSGGIHVLGSTVPGVPVIFQGHNGHVAWSCTVSFADTTDYYIERLSTDGSSVDFKGEWIALVERELHYADDQRAVGRWVPHHGPIVWENRNRSLALSARWNGHDAPTDIEVYWDLARAGRITDAVEVTARAKAIGCNNALADTEGQVAMVLMAEIPGRSWAATYPPWRPLPGDGSAEWEEPLDPAGTIAIAPREGYVASANNAFDAAWRDGDPTNDELPYRQNYASPGFRLQRIRQVLDSQSATHQVEDSIQLQNDTRIGNAAPMVDAVARLLDREALEDAASLALEVLSQWNATCPTGLATRDLDSPLHTDASIVDAAIGCSVFHVFLAQAADDAFRDELESAGIEVGSLFFAVDALYRLLVEPERSATGNALWNDVSTPEPESAVDIVEAALEAAGAWLLGREIEDRVWGRIHTLRLENPITRETLGPVASNGGHISVNPSGFSISSGPRFHQHTSAVFRMVVEMDPNGPRMYLQVPGGTDGDPSQPYYANLLAGYLRGEAVQVPFGHD